MNPSRKDTNNRQPQFELLRVLCMFGIVVTHFFTYGLDIYGLREEVFTLSVDSTSDAVLWAVLEGMKLISLACVNCFVLISGYFMVNEQGFRLNGIKKVWSQTWFYSVTIFLVLCILGIESFSTGKMLQLCFPVFTNQYWFITSYVALMLLAPFLSRMVSFLDKSGYVKLLVIGFFLCFQYAFGQIFMDSNKLLLFVYLFIVGGYIRRFGVFQDIRKRYCGLLAVAVYLLMFAVAVIKNMRSASDAYLIYAMEDYSLVLPLSVLLFVAFTEVRCSSFVSRVIPLFSESVLAVYLIHSHPVMQEWMWKEVGDYVLSCPPVLLPLFCLFFSLVIFVLCVAVDGVRRGFLFFLPRKK